MLCKNQKALRVKLNIASCLAIEFMEHILDQYFYCKFTLCFVVYHLVQCCWEKGLILGCDQTGKNDLLLFFFFFFFANFFGVSCWFSSLAKPNFAWQ